MGASPPASSLRIFHIVGAAASAVGGPRPGAVVARDQFERHGFVHCCFREQLAETATWWFDPGDDLVALELDVARLSAEVRIEASPTRWYPHLFGPIDADAVVASHPLPRDGGSVYLPPSLATPPPGYRLTGIVEGSERSVCWRLGSPLAGDAAWRTRAEAAVAAGRTVELMGGIVVPATLDAPYESFAVLAEVTDDGAIVRYDGDGFFTSP